MVRTPAEYAAGHIPSARNVPLDRLEEELPNLPSNGHPVIVCCRSGQRSAIAAELLAQAGGRCTTLALSTAGMAR